LDFIINFGCIVLDIHPELEIRIIFLRKLSQISCLCIMRPRERDLLLVDLNYTSSYIVTCISNYFHPNSNNQISNSIICQYAVDW